MESIKFYIGEENGIVLENTETRFTSSLFFEQYKHVFSLIQSIWIDKTSTIESNSHGANENSSNIVAICGDRGEGKSSLLFSICEILRDSKVYDAAKKAGLFSNDSINVCDNTIVIDVIDPSYFDDKHNIIELLLGQMYAKLKVEQQKNHECLSECYTNLLKQFAIVKDNLSILQKTNDPIQYDKLEEIDNLANGIQLRKNLDKLFSLYATAFQKKRLVIAIDDLDLNIQGGYELVEQIRKYISLSPHCIVLVALKVDQMVDIIKSRLKDQLKNDSNNSANVEEMATRYITKLLPLGNRVWMPQGNDIIERELEILKKGKSTPLYAKQTLKETVVRLIFDKTRYIFVNGAGVSPIVPTNLRSLRTFLGTICNLQDAKKGSPEHLENKNIFKRYFYQVWINNLCEEDRTFARQLVSIDDVRLINKFVVSHLKQLIMRSQQVDGIATNFIEESLLNSIIDPSNTVYNVSLGDAFFVLRNIEQITTKDEDKKLLFFIKAFYSIKLYELYDSISDSEDHLFPKSISSTPSIYKYDQLFQEENILQKLLNGAYFTYSGGYLLSRTKEDGQNCDRRLINKKEITERLSMLYQAHTDQQVLSNEQILHLKACEFFAMTTVRQVGKNKNLIDDVNLGTSRTSIDPIYLLQYEPGNDCLVFDALSIFYNLINIKWCYQKMDKLFQPDSETPPDITFYDFAASQECSLLNRVLSITGTNKETELERKSSLPLAMHALISDATIRFAEVQFAILDELHNNKLRQKNKSSGENSYKLSQLYQAIQKLGICLYPLNKEKNGYHLSFEFLTPIIEFLDKISEAKFSLFFNPDFPQESTNEFEVIDEIKKVNIARWFNSLFKAIGVNYPIKGQKILDLLKTSCPQITTVTKRKYNWGRTFPYNTLFIKPEQIYEALSNNYNKYAKWLIEIENWDSTNVSTEKETTIKENK